MRPIMTAVIAAIEACAVALAGLLAVGIPALALWIVGFNMEADPAVILGGSVSAWLLAHFIPLNFRISPEIALGYGLPPEAVDFVVSLAPLGLTVLTLVLAARAGLRFARDGGGGAAGVIGGMFGFGAATMVLSRFAIGIDQTPLWMVVLIPTTVYTVAALIAFLVRAVFDGHPWWQRTQRWLLQQLTRLGVKGAAALPQVVAQTLRLMMASLAILTAIAALGVGAAIIAGYIEITALTQSLQLDVVGAIVLVLLQAALLPVLCLWAIAWLSGAGFAIGAGSSISPFGALTGPLPSLPILGAIPQGWGSAAILAPALVVVFALGLGVLAARLTDLRIMGWVARVSVPVLAAALTGLVIAGAMMLASGSIGPDRLGTVGPEPWLVGGLVAAELALGLILGVLAGKVDRDRLREMFPTMDRTVDPVADSNYLSVSKSPSREALFRSVGRRRRTSAVVGAAAESSETTEPETTVGADAQDTLPIDGRGLPVSEDGAPTDDLSDLDPLRDDARVGLGVVADADMDADMDSAVEEDSDTGVSGDTELDLSATEEAELLQAFSWDEQPDERSEETPRRAGWRWPGAKG